MNVYFVTDRHWAWLVRAKTKTEAKKKLQLKRSDVSVHLEATQIEFIFDKYDDVVGLEGLEPPYDSHKR